VADLVQVPTGEGWLYLGVILDVWHRGVVGWAMRQDARAELVVDALEMALWRTAVGVPGCGVNSGAFPRGLDGEGHRWVPFGLGKHQLEGRDVNATGGPGIQDGTVGAVALNSRGTGPWTCCGRGCGCWRRR
jgi:hypothetical protein